ncbi:MAG: VCBS repeat-containing protein [Bacteroidales bacterium]|nr:VCBS repeat-containing protein [Bacteroidales bacterium]
MSRVLAGSVLIVFLSHGVAAELTPLRYHHPGLAVDLGVGLWAWPIPVDVDGDGDYDLIVSCPDKPSNGIWFFENTTGDTARQAMPIFQPPQRLSATVHYVMPSWVDGQLRVLSPGFEYPQFRQAGLQKRTRLPVPANWYKPRWKQPKGPKVRHNQWRYADYDGDGVADLVVGIEDWSDYGWDDAWNERGEWKNGPLHGFVFVLRNTGTNAAPEYADPVQIEADGKLIDTFGCPSPNFVDGDGDGDLDLICGEFLDGFTYFQNIGTRTRPRYAAGVRLQTPNGQPLVMDLEMIVPVAFDWDRDGHPDLIVGDEDGRVAFVRNTGSRTTAGVPLFEAPRYFQQRADTLKCGALATPVGVDWDGDGDTDIVSGNTAGYIEIFENLSGPKVAEPKWAAPKKLLVNGQPFRVMAGPNGSIQGPAEAKWGYTTLQVADWDQDGKLDVVFNSIRGRVQWLRNMGSRSQPRFAPPQLVQVEWPGDAPKPGWEWQATIGKELVTQWRTTPVVYDLNRDGLLDLVMLDTEGYLSFYERSRQGGKRILLPPRRALTNPSGAPLRFNAGTAGKSGRRKLCLTDWDGDGIPDILLNSTSADLYRGMGQHEGQWRYERIGPLVEQNIEGHDVSPTVVDFDGDGVPDFLGGAEDGRFYFLRNPRSVVKAP